MIRDRDGRRFISPVVGVYGRKHRDAWVRPGELLVDVGAQTELAARLRRDHESGGPYRPGGEGDWRRRPGAPNYGNVNAELERYGARVRLWTGLDHYYAVHLVLEEAMKGVHLHHVLVGEDFYHGGPGGMPSVDAGPTGSLPAYNGDGNADIAVLDNGLPGDWTGNYGGLEQTVNSLAPQNTDWDPLDENNDDTLDEQAGHGVFICGLIARVAPKLDVNLYRVLHATGEGDEALIMNTLGPLVNSDVAVVNLSLGGYTVNDVEPQLAQTIRTLYSAGKVVVAAAGNSGLDPAFNDRRFWPATMQEVVAVGAYNSTAGAVKYWPPSRGGDIYAPGVDLLSNYVRWQGNPPTFARWARWSGTSFATPLVAAHVAQLVAGAPAGTASRKVDDWRRNDLPGAGTWPTKVGGTEEARQYTPATDTTVWP
jgi:hypothetical protein